MTSVREFIESQDNDLEIGADESMKFPFNIPKSWQQENHNPDTPTFILEDEDGTDVTSTYTTGSATVGTGLYTSPLITGLVEDQVYKMICGWNDDPNTLEAFGWLRCT